jgi:hypothetical protein
MLIFLHKSFLFKKNYMDLHIYMASKGKSFTFKQFYTNLNEFTQIYTYMSMVKHSHLH